MADEACPQRFHAFDSPERCHSQKKLHHSLCEQPEQMRFRECAEPSGRRLSTSRTRKRRTLLARKQRRTSCCVHGNAGQACTEHQQRKLHDGDSQSPPRHRCVHLGVPAVCVARRRSGNRVPNKGLSHVQRTIVVSPPPPTRALPDAKQRANGDLRTVREGLCRSSIRGRRVDRECRHSKAPSLPRVHQRRAHGPPSQPRTFTAVNQY